MTLPAGFSAATITVSDTPVHTPRQVTIPVFMPAPLRLVVLGAPALTLKRCDGPADPIDMLAAYRKRRADYDAIQARRLQRIEGYLHDRCAR